jgi:hypothetical protein
MIINLRYRSYRRPWVFTGGFLFDGYRGRKAFQGVYIRFVHLPEKLPGIGREGLYISSLSFGVEGVKGKGGFAGTGQAGEDDQAISRKIDIDIFEIMHPRAADSQCLRFH